MGRPRTDRVACIYQFKATGRTRESPPLGLRDECPRAPVKNGCKTAGLHALGQAACELDPESSENLSSSSKLESTQFTVAV